MKSSVYIATSLDGFIAGENGDLAWLDAANESVPEGEDCGYQAFIDSVDTLVMGRNTFDKVLSFGIEWPYAKTRVIVLSRHPITFPSNLPDNVSHSSEDPQTLCDRLVQEGANHIYVDGGITIQRFLKAGLIDEITITTIPIILGNGASLFGTIEREFPLELVESKAFEFGFVQTKYRVG